MNKSFKDLSLKEELLKAIDLMGYKELTKVQKESIPHILEGKNLVVKSQTGSGKTAAYSIPICNNIDWDERYPQALIVVPTRELAIQVKEEIFNLGRFLRLKVLDIYGKSPYRRQARDLGERVHIVVGTPGRLIDHIEKGNLKTNKISYLVLDESDEMLNMGFLDQVETIIKALPSERTSLLFSATMPEDIEELSRKYLEDPKYIELESSNTTMDRIEQFRYKVDKSNKLDILKEVLVVENPDNAIVFCNTRDEVDYLYRQLKKEGYSLDKIHGGMYQEERSQVMEDFKMAKFRYLIATDVAARGIDVEDISHVINYDIPAEEESYIHRIGRTGRKGKTGRAISFHDNYEGKYIGYIENYTGRKIKLVDRPDKELVNASVNSFKNKMKTRQELVIKSEKINEGILKLHINAGKKTKMRAGDIVGAICSIEGLDGDDIGVINIIEISSFVEILNNKGEYVLDKLQTTEIKGRLRTVSRARA